MQVSGTSGETAAASLIDPAQTMLRRLALALLLTVATEKKLAGAAKTSLLKKCVKDAVG